MKNKNILKSPYQFKTLKFKKTKIIPSNGENGKLTAEQGSENTCMSPKRCYITDETGRETIITQIKSEKEENERKCTQLNSELGTAFETCLLQNTLDYINYYFFY